MQPYVTGAGPKGASSGRELQRRTVGAPDPPSSRGRPRNGTVLQPLHPDRVGRLSGLVRAPVAPRLDPSLRTRSDRAPPWPAAPGHGLQGVAPSAGDRVHRGRPCPAGPRSALPLQQYPPGRGQGAPGWPLNRSEPTARVPLIQLPLSSARPSCCQPSGVQLCLGGWTTMTKPPSGR